jgi:retron-type reverse transcriptase
MPVTADDIKAEMELEYGIGDEGAAAVANLIKVVNRLVPDQRDQIVIWNALTRVFDSIRLEAFGVPRERSN